MAYAGICGSDIHLVETDPETGYVRSSAPAVIPAEGRVIGHEGVGKVVDAGSRVRNVSPGAWVAFESIIACYACDVCRRGGFNQCRTSRLLGLETDGLFGTVVDVPARTAHDVSGLGTDARSLMAAACFEPAGVAYVACGNARIEPGDHVVVFGGGPIGIISAMLARDVFGAARVALVEPVAFRRHFAAQWCDSVDDVEAYFAGSPLPVDVVIEASGDVENVDRVMGSVDANGRIVLLGRSGTPLIINQMDRLISNGISIMGSRGHLGGAFHRVMRLREQGRLPLEDIVTDVVMGLDGLLDTLKSPAAIVERNCKVLVRLNDGADPQSPTLRGK
jgi:threonine dehydrogenase-like Zn-dependent dehydrogenase